MDITEIAVKTAQALQHYKQLLRLQPTYSQAFASSQDCTEIYVYVPKGVRSFWIEVDPDGDHLLRHRSESDNQAPEHCWLKFPLPEDRKLSDYQPGKVIPCQAAEKYDILVMNYRPTTPLL